MVFGSVAAAEEYPCATDPGFCYLDVGGDNCWDDGTDTGPIDALLAGTYAPGTPGSIVCPPGAQPIIASQNIDWDTEPGGHILLYGTKVDAKDESDVRLTAGGRIFVNGQLKASDYLRLLAKDDVTLDGKFSAPNRSVLPYLTIESLDANILLTSRTKLTAARLYVDADNGNVTFEDRVKIRGLPGEEGNRGEVDITTGGHFSSLNLSVVADDARFTTTGNALYAGRTIIGVRNADGARLSVGSTGDLTFEYILAKAPRVSIGGSASTTLGATGALPILRRSKLKSTDKFSANIDLWSNGPLMVDFVKARAPKHAELDLYSAGSSISFVNSSIKAGGFRVRPQTSPTTCDLTGSNWKTDSADFSDCDTLIGP